MSASSEIACRLGISRRRASDMIERGEALCEPDLSRAAGMLRAGLIDPAKFSLCERRLEGVGSELCLQVQDQVLPQAVHRTHAQLARDLDKALAVLDPKGVSQRRRRDTAGRHVTRPHPAGVGTSEMRMLLPTPDAYLLDATLEAVAASARAMGDGRTLPQLRADALVSMSLDLLRGSQHEAARECPEPGRASACGCEGRLNGLRGGEDHAPAGHDGACGGGGCVPVSHGSGCGDQSRVPVRPDPARMLPDGVPLDALVASLSRLVSGTSPWWTPSGVDRVPYPAGLQVRVDVTVPVDTLARFQGLEALQDHPADRAEGAGISKNAGNVRNVDRLGGPGSTEDARRTGSVGSVGSAESTAGAVLSIGGHSTPVPAAVAVALAAGGTWRRLLTDPVSGTVLDVGRRRYRPPAALADAVRARDVSCTHPGCEVPARRCDIDHIRPWSQGGTTSLDNLTLLCQAHHYLKHSPGWSLTRTEDGGLVWRTPTGARYRRDPDGSIRMLAARVGPRQRHQDEHPVASVLERAVTEEVLARLERGLSSGCGPGSGWDGSDPAPGWDGSDPAPGQDGPSPAPDLDSRHSLPALRDPERGRSCLETRGPRPGQRAGDFEPHGYPPELHELGLAELLDAAVPF
nr:HNH endonuclease signature motif containing protein [Actinomyces sp.]